MVKGQLIHFITGGVLSGMLQILFTPFDPICGQRIETNIMLKGQLIHFLIGGVYAIWGQ